MDQRVESFIVDISGEKVEVEIAVNKEGNLMIGGIGHMDIVYDMLNGELVLSKYQG